VVSSAGAGALMGATLGFEIRMALRELRGGARHIVSLFGCVALGVAAIVAVGTLAATVDRTLTREAKTLLGGDLEVRSARPLEASAEAAIERLRRAGATVTEIRELVAMSRQGEGTSLLVELKAIDGSYPLYGHLTTAPADPLPVLLGNRGVVVEPEVLRRLDVEPGDRITIGAETFTIRGVVGSEPDRATGFFALGPRVFLARSALDGTGLVQPGSRVRYRTLLRLPPALAPRSARQALARDLADPTIRVVALDEAQPGLRRSLTQLASYLGLVGLASLLVGGIGVASAIGSLMKRRRATIAVLKCLGAESRTILRTYLVQSLLIGLAGSVAGALLGLAGQPLVLRLLAGLVPFPLVTGIDAGALVRGVAMGGLTTVLCAVWPLLEIRAIPPSLVLRRDVEIDRLRFRPPWRAGLPIVAGLAALALWQAGSLGIAGIFLGGAVAALAILALLARLLVVGERALPRPRTFAWRQGLAGLRRPGGHASGVIVALGVGVMLLVAVALLDASLRQHMDHAAREDTPSFFFVDIQPDQRDTFTALLAQTGGTPAVLTPVVRSRLAEIDSVPVTREAIERRRTRGDDRTWYFTRDYVLTWAAEVPTTNRISRGRWWTAAEAAARARISVEADAAKYLGVDVGSTLTFDVQGVRITAEVMSLREVDWQTLSTNFFVIFSQGALDGAPTTFVATARVPRAREAPLQDAVTARLPNVTAVPVRDVLERVASVLDRIAVAVRVMALLTVATGLVVMAGALAASRSQRLYESVVLRALGATRGAVARAFAVEYACLGAVAGLGGTLLAVALAWGVLRFVLEVPPHVPPAALALGILLSTGVALAVGFLATFRLLGQKPLPILRQE